MNIATNIIFLVITATFMGVYAYNLVLNLVRAIKTNKLLKADPQKIEATVVEVKQVKKTRICTCSIQVREQLANF